MELIQQYGNILVIITAIFGFFMAFGIGANDVSNAMGTSVGSGTITARQAIVIAMVFEFAGAYLAGGEVTETIKSGIIDISFFADKPDILVLGMMSALFAAGFWLLVASKMGWPVSTTHAIIGAIIGFGCLTVGSEAVQWKQLGGIVGSWFITPVIAGFVAYWIFISTQKLIFDTDEPMKNAQKYGPLYMALTAFILSIVTMTKGLKHVGLHLTTTETVLISSAIAAVAVVTCYFYFRSEAFAKRAQGAAFGGVEKVFSILMLLTACSMAFAHGSNDVANAVGPLSAVVSIVHSGGVVEGKAALASWILPLGAAGIAAGMLIMGYKVMGTMGTGITDLTPSRGFSAEFACAATVVIASGTGLPISTTQTIVGAILGVGFARGIAALNLGIIRNIVASWVVTLPAGAIIAIVIYEILLMIFY
ncbi:inorganic phosphate transporter [Actinobacillus pleuropneumoniae]|uniref:Phosphate transporter n=1 Tax=Actinobacillus pleuropneumoniae TaxID=715 RepID=A0A9Q4DHR2_ACTPL|nr:inorganic phosphate transporter [Actinobacillus pleuropneumoniae]MCL7720469.1 inorganic phosphate transporter [Actinobacillus pleuropneumoniae]MCL7727984.1 inorganic phosphate transporter [Actinobacillus pleuropneumoniae]MCL7729664.1 inorganic phosphate transporter [Actinobacillus pleuropneumoniae]MCY6367646.1 inorganic phosphate transporter [Actinobacillus pleuropneumoniae]MCY6384514.1 inorganic phosphate transporter [Actinobacillus pleuropneumoniae]